MEEKKCAVFSSSLLELKGQMHHQNDLGLKWAYTCHLSNKTYPEPVLFSTTQL